MLEKKCEVLSKKIEISCCNRMTGMDIVEVSKRIYRFQKDRVAELGVELTPELVFFHLSEEIGEIARQLVNKNLPMREYEEENLKEEVAEAILDLLVLSEVFNINLPKALNGKIDEMAERRVMHETSKSL
jgi:NTP pyrophosphatase (non-canonical NTP hydrolase)